MARRGSGKIEKSGGAVAAWAAAALLCALAIAPWRAIASDPAPEATPTPVETPAPASRGDEASPTPTPGPAPTPAATPAATPALAPAATPAPTAAPTPRPATVDAHATPHATPRPTPPPAGEEPPPRNLSLDLTRVALEQRDEAHPTTATLRLGDHEAPATGTLRVDARLYKPLDLQNAFASFLRTARPDAARSTDTLALFRANFALQGLVADRARAEAADRDEEFQRLLEQRVNELLTEHYLRKRVLGDIAVSAAEVEEYYATHPEEFTQPRLITLRLVVVGTAEEAEEARKRLENGIAFEKVAEELSIHASRQKGGLLKPMARGSLDSRVEAVAWELGLDEVSAPIPVDGLYYIVKSLGATAATVEDLETARPRLLEKLYETKRRARLRDFARELLANHRVVLFDAEAAPPPAEVVIAHPRPDAGRRGDAPRARGAPLASVESPRPAPLPAWPGSSSGGAGRGRVDNC
jgi:hypothetical protein